MRGLLDETPICGLEAEAERRAIAAGFDVRAVKGEDQGLVAQMCERADERLA